MGLHLCMLIKRALEKSGKENTVWAASRFRSLRGCDAYHAVGVRTLVGDFRDEAFVASLPNCPTVFYLVGAKFGTADNPELLQEINVEVAERLAARFRTARIVALSTGCVYSYVTPESGGSDESSRTESVGAYAASCVERENQFAGASARFGTRIALVRLNYAVEFRYGVLVDIATKVLRGEPVDVSTGFVNVIWQTDALNHIAQALCLADSPAKPINITGPEIVRVRDLAMQFGELLGREPRFVGKEQPTAWLSNAGRSHQLFGKPEVAPATMIRWVAAWLARDGSTYDKPTGFERRDGKF